MKLSDYIASFIRQLNIRHVFVVTGGAAIHLIDSIAHTDGVDYICAQHEQGAAMMADAYARVHGIAVAMSTSGPGATNMITGTACGFFDSVPVLHITGQVSTFRLRRDSGVRQLGFQEADTVDLFRPVTKYAVLLEDKADIRYELEKAVHIARTGRPGPVLVDVPDNLQREDIGDPEDLRSYHPQDPSPANSPQEAQIGKLREMLGEAKRPVLILGWGVRCAGGENLALKIVERLNIPFMLTWAALDLTSHKSPLYIGTFGTHGSRAGNLAVQNADLVISIGSRLDTHHTGTPRDFAREAKLAMIDIDPTELNKFKNNDRGLDLAISMDAKQFMEELLKCLDREAERSQGTLESWAEKVESWRERYPVFSEIDRESLFPSPYLIFDELTRLSAGTEYFFADTGCSLAWMMSAFHPHGEQRVFSAFNYTPMGYALPASIGGAFASKRVCVCVTGDGGLQMNIQELATCMRHCLPIKVLLFDNDGYSMIQQTQEQWMDARYYAANVEQGLAFPNFIELARVYGFTTFDLQTNDQVVPVLRDFLAASGPCLCRVKVPSDCRVVPQLKFGRPLEDQEPLLPRDEFFNNLIVKPLDISLKQ